MIVAFGRGKETYCGENDTKAGQCSEAERNTLAWCLVAAPRLSLPKPSNFVPAQQEKASWHVISSMAKGRLFGGQDEFNNHVCRIEHASCSLPNLYTVFHSSFASADQRSTYA